MGESGVASPWQAQCQKLQQALDNPDSPGSPVEPEKLTALAELAAQMCTEIRDRAMVDPQQYSNIWRQVSQLALHKDWSDRVPEALRFHLGTMLKDCIQQLESSSGHNVPNNLPDLVNNPWNHPWLAMALIGENPIVPKASEAFVCEPSPIPLLRVQALYEGKCYKAAFNYLKALQKHNIFGFELLAYRFVLGHKLKTQSRRLSLTVAMPEEDLVRLLDAFVPKQTEEVEALLPKGLRSYVTLTVREEIHRDLCSDGIYRLVNDRLYRRDAIQKLVSHSLQSPKIHFEDMLQAALSDCDCAPLHIALADCMMDKLGPNQDKVQLTKLYIRAAVLLLNHIEIQRTSINCQDEDLDKFETLLADVMLSLAQLHQESDVLYREELLTAFSLRPSQAIFDKIAECAKKIEENLNLKQEAMDVNDVKNLEAPLALSDEISQFETACDDMLASLKKPFGRSRARLRPGQIIETSQGIRSKVEGISSIEGSVLTSASRYLPSQAPLEIFKKDEEVLGAVLLRDLVIVITTPRWHLLSWIIEWNTLKERCIGLLENPSLRIRRSPILKHVKVDYTQFEAASSDDEVEEAPSAIEKGYEDWDVDTSDDEEKSN